MLAEGLALSLTLSHPASSRASRDYAGTRRERELGCGYAAFRIKSILLDMIEKAVISFRFAAGRCCQTLV